MSLRNFSINTRLTLAFSMLLLILCSVGGIGAMQIKRVQLDADELGMNWLPSIQILASIQSTANMVRRASLRHVIEGSVEKKQIQEEILLHAKDNLISEMGAYEKLISSSEERKLYEQMRTLWNIAWAVDQEMVRLSQGGDEQVDKARALATESGADTFAQFLEVVVQAIEINRAGGSKAAEESGNDYYLAIYLLSGLVALAMLVGVLLSWVITRSITGPLQTAVYVANTIASGDLTANISVEGSDEPAQLIAAMREMNHRLCDIMIRIRHSSDSIATGSSEIAAGSMDLSQRTEQQASNLEETAASMEALTTTVRTNAETAHQGHRVASTASALATEGGQSVARVVLTMQEISEASRKIAEITNVIDSIAFQTNILALNAAVEAARAGDEGRGFAVVASEVRALAQRSGTAAREIKDLIGINLDKVEQGTQVATQAGEQMGRIVEQVRSVDIMISEISNASSEQAVGIKEVSEAVSQLDHMTQQNAALVEQSTAAAASLEMQSTTLTEIVATFKIHPEHKLALLMTSEESTVQSADSWRTAEPSHNSLPLISENHKSRELVEL